MLINVCTIKSQCIEAKPRRTHTALVYSNHRLVVLLTPANGLLSLHTPPDVHRQHPFHSRSQPLSCPLSDLKPKPWTNFKYGTERKAALEKPKDGFILIDIGKTITRIPGLVWYIVYARSLFSM